MNNKMSSKPANRITRIQQCTLNVVHTNSLGQNVPSCVPAKLNDHSKVNLQRKSDSFGWLLNLCFMSCCNDGYSNAQYLVCASYVALAEFFLKSG